MTDKARTVPRELDPGGRESVRCRECDALLGQVTASHLSSHGMTVDEYRERYPGAPLQSDDTKSRGGWSGPNHIGGTDADAR